MTDERKNELGNAFIQKGFAAEALSALDIGELCFLTRTARQLTENPAFGSAGLSEKLALFKAALADKLKASDALLMAYDAATEYPYIDPDERAWLFSRQSYALDAQEYYAKQSVSIEIRKIIQGEIEEAFAEFAQMGIETLLLDNGYERAEIERSIVAALPDWSGTPEISIPVSNPKLMFAMIRFFQALHAKNGGEGRQNILTQLEERMLDEVLSARFLVPMRVVKRETAEREQAGTLTPGDTLEFVQITGEDGTKLQPAYTDWIEFRKAFDPGVWGGHVASYDDLLALSRHIGGAVINTSGLPLLINEPSRQRIEEYRRFKKADTRHGQEAN